MESIKSMCSKITGVKVNSLKELWRWLKGIGMVCTWLKKWKVKINNCLANNP